MGQARRLRPGGDIVVVWRIDRLGGSLLDVLQTVTDLQARGTAVRSISDGIDPTTPTGRLMLGMLATGTRSAPVGEQAPATSGSPPT